MNINVITTQVKREYWENKTGFLYVPVIMTGLILVLILAAAIFSNGAINKNGMQFHGKVEQTTDESNFNGHITIDEGKAINLHDVDLSTMTKEHPKFFGLPVVGAIYSNSLLLTIVFFIVLLTYAHSCLFDDRKNRDILFWRSMPVSETTNVLVKLSVLILLAPFVMLGLNIVVGIITLLGSIVFFTSHGVSLGTIFTSVAESHAAITAFRICGISFITLILLMPVFSFILFCSSLAKKSPFFTSSLIPLSLIAIDRLVNAMVGINLHVIDLFNAYGNALKNITDAIDPDGAITFEASTIFIYVGAMCVGALFIGASVWLRNNRYEI